MTRKERVLGRYIYNVPQVEEKGVENKKEKLPLFYYYPVSIIIPAFKNEYFIEECLNSIKNQTSFKDFNEYEILVGVDGCVDTLEKLKTIEGNYKNLRIFFTEKNVGWPLIKNSLTDKAKYDNLLFFDADDVMDENMVSEIYSVLKNNPELELIRFKHDVYLGSAKGSCFIKKETFERLNGYVNYHCSSDREFIIRCEKNNVKSFIINDKALFFYRKHSDQLTRNKKTNMVSPLRKQYHKMIDEKNNWEKTEKETISLVEIKRKPKICFTYDKKNWAFYYKSQHIKKHLEKYYDIDLVSYIKNSYYNQYDAVISFYPKSYKYFLKYSRLNGFDLKKLILGISSQSITNKTQDFLNEVEFVFSNNPNSYNQIENINNFFCPNGIDLDFYCGEKRKGLDLDKPVRIAIVGSENRKKHKGVERIAEICEKLKEKGYNIINNSLIVNIIPSSTNLLSQEEMREYYKSVDIFIVSSVAEGTPNPLLEAMAMGIPCISNLVGFAPLLIENSVTGFLVDDYNEIDDYVDKIEKLITNKRLYEKISKNSLNKIKEYDWKEMSLNYKNMIDKFFLKEKKVVNREYIKENIDDLLTVVIRSVGERTEQYCYNLIEKCIDSKNISIVNKTPFIKALKESYEIGIKENRKWTLVVDADVLVEENSILNLLEKSESLHDKTFAVLGRCFDKFLNKERIVGIRIYRTKFLKEAIKLIPRDINTIRPEAHVIHESEKQGMLIHKSKIYLGKHDFEQYYRDIYRKNYTHANKHRGEIDIGFFKKNMFIDSDYLVAYRGYSDGLIHTGPLSIDTNLPCFRKTKIKKILKELGLEEKNVLSLPVKEKTKNICIIGECPSKFEENFLTYNNQIYENYGFTVKRYKNSKEFSLGICESEIDKTEKNIVINIYNEDNIPNDAYGVEEILNNKIPNSLLIHPTSLGKILGNKKLTNDFLTQRGILCPKQITTKRKINQLVFQNEVSSSNSNTKILGVGDYIDETKYNCEFINTNYVFKGETYYSIIRAICVGKKITSIFLRFRNILEENPSVHNKNTPLIPELINSYYYEKIKPNYNALNDICEKIGGVLGLGFYIHDIALCSTTNKFYLIETGFKLHDRVWSQHLDSIKNEVFVDVDRRIIMKKMAYEFCLQLKKMENNEIKLF